MSDKPKAIVVGTGFGGAVTAHRLVHSGFDVVVLERGRRYEGNDFPSLPRPEEVFPDFARWAWSSSLPGTPGKPGTSRRSRPSHWSAAQGLWDVRDMGDTLAVHAAGFGGGSLVYANVHLRAPADVFAEGWPKDVTREALEPYYDRVACQLDIKPITESPNGTLLPKTVQLNRAAKALDRPTFYPPLAIHFGPPGKNAAGKQQNACSLCGECDTGCRIAAKNTLDLNYLVDVDAKADVRTLAEVLTISASADGYVVSYFDHTTRTPRRETARYVFLCAGSMCTTEILLRSRQAGGLPLLDRTLGSHFYGNSDSVAVAFDTDEVHQPGRGPTITTALVHQDKGAWLMVQDGGYPAAMTRAIGTVRARALLGRNAYPSRAPRSFGDPMAMPVPQGRVAPFRALPDALYWILKNGDLGRAPSNMVPQELRDALSSLLTATQELGRTQVAAIVPIVSAKMRERVVDTLLRRLCLSKWGWLRRRLLRWGPKVQEALGVTDDTLTGFAQDSLVERYAPTVDNLARVGSWLVEWEMEPSKPEHRAALLSMGRDSAPGRYVIDAETDQLQVRLDLDPRAQTYSEQERLMRDLAAQWKAELRVNPLWAAARKPVTVHQQGGCPMSDRPDEGVVNGWGEVHAYPGLFVFDGAALPRAVGVNPSSTIAALAERNVEHFVTTCKLPGIAWRLDDGEPQRIAAWKKRAAGWALEPVGAVAHPFQSKPIGIKFTEVMTGFHAPLPRQDKLTHGLLDRLNIDRRARTPHPRLDVSPEPGEYEAAYRRGCPVNVLSLTMHAFMEDIVAFEADRDHRMAMTGDVVLRWPERGIDCKASFDAGSYASLFVPLRFEQGVGKDRFMLYDLSFEEPSGPRWYVLGFKRMHIGEGTGAWADTTNLFVTVWCPERDLITEGVARLPMETLLYETMGELEVTGTEDPARRAWAIATFGAVFFGHLGEIYLPALRRYQALLGGQLLKRRS